MAKTYRGIVERSEHHRAFGIIREDISGESVFFHFSNYAEDKFVFGDGVVFHGYEDRMTFPQVGDVIHYRKIMWMEGPKAVEWVYEEDRQYAEALAARLKKLKERSLVLTVERIREIFHA